ncbi:MAG: indolepyruvate oxidoreductase subunit beta [Desulfobacterales bacterium]|nr:MAG: indolepyruvate oxidoreductase subunit beta [Desulfobacterales bacterium]
MQLNILICGVGGQGNVLLEKVLGLSAIHEGQKVRAADTFGASQRGGSVLSHIRLGSGVSSSLVPRGDCDILLGLEPVETLRAAVPFLSEDGLLIFNTAPVPPAKVKAGEVGYPATANIIELLGQLTPNLVDLDATALAKATTGSERAMNMAMAGVLLGLGVLPLSPGTVKDVISKITGAFAAKNVKAFEAGYEAGLRRRGDIQGAR